MELEKNLVDNKCRMESQRGSERNKLSASVCWGHHPLFAKDSSLAMTHSAPSANKEANLNRHFDSSAIETGQGQASVKKGAHWIFSTRWPPIPIRATHSGKTTAGRLQQQTSDDESTEFVVEDIPFYDRSPADAAAGLPTMYSGGTVAECMYWQWNSGSELNVEEELLIANQVIHHRGG